MSVLINLSGVSDIWEDLMDTQYAEKIWVDIGSLCEAYMSLCKERPVLYTEQMYSYKTFGSFLIYC